MSFQKLNTIYRSTDAKVMNTILSDSADRIQTQRVSFEKIGNNYVYSFDNTPAIQQFLQKNNTDNKIGTIEVKDGKILLTSDKAYIINISEQYNGNKLHTHISIQSQVPQGPMSATENQTGAKTEAETTAELQREFGNEGGERFLSKAVAGYSRTNRRFAQMLKSISVGDYQK